MAMNNCAWCLKELNINNILEICNEKCLNKYMEYKYGTKKRKKLIKPKSNKRKAK